MHDFGLFESKSQVVVSDSYECELSDLRWYLYIVLLLYKKFTGRVEDDWGRDWKTSRAATYYQPFLVTEKRFVFGGASLVKVTAL